MSAKEQDPRDGIIKAAGGLVRHMVDRELLVALVHRPKYDDWTLPKGKLKTGESWLEGAKREVEEEIQCEVKVGDFAGCSCYVISGVPKIVLFWDMELVKSRPFTANEEIDRVLWLPLDQAIIKLDHDNERTLLVNE